MCLRGISKDDLLVIVNESLTKREVIAKLGLVPAGGNYKTLNKVIEKYGINTDHLFGYRHLSGKKHLFAPKKKLSEILIDNSTYSCTSRLKKRLINCSCFTHKCYSCGNKEWLGKKIPLELEHINGNNSDNRLGNLILLCPNCHAMTPTYRGRNIGDYDDIEFINYEKCIDCGCNNNDNEFSRCHKCIDEWMSKIDEVENSVASKEVKDNNSKIDMGRRRRIKNKCVDCSRPIDRKSTRCKSCSVKIRSIRKVEWPSKDLLEEMIDTMSWCAIGRKYGVSDNAVRKWARSYGII